MPKLLLQKLVQNGVITELIARDISLSIENGEDLDVDDALQKRGVSGEDLRKYRADIYGIFEYKEKPNIDQELIKYISEEMARKYKTLPLIYTDKLLVGIVDPENKEAIETIQTEISKKGKEFTFVLITKDQFNLGLESYYSLPKKEEEKKKQDFGGSSLVLSDVASVAANIGKEEYVNLTETSNDLGGDIEKQQIEEVVKRILKYSIEKGASDIHIEPMEDTVRVRTRLDGFLSLALKLPNSIGQPLVARVKILADMKLDEKRKPQDGRFSTRMDQHKVDFRVSVLPGYYGEKVVIRILDSYRGVKALKDIGFSDRHLADIRKALERPYGMILISGPTGSGKTTTLYSMLSELDRKTRNVISLEDPIEYNVADMTQSQIFPEIGYTFATGLRSILRQDPDVIMVGEIRDAETAQLAIQAALTGHLVFSTIHTNNAVGIIPRLRDMGVDPYLIAPTLCLAIAQRLVRRIAPSSAHALAGDPAMNKLVEESFAKMPDNVKAQFNLNRPLNEAIASAMNPTGMKGRIPVVESIYIDDDIQKAILENKNEDEMWNLAQSKGAVSMRQDAILKSMDGLVPFVEINGL